MTFVLWRKLLRDVRVPLLAVCLALFVFEVFWVKVVERVTTEIAPMLGLVSLMQGRQEDFLMNLFLKGPGRVIQSVLGGADVRFNVPQDMLAVGHMHPVVLIVVGLWGVGRASLSMAGEIDRGTMELLLAQPIKRSRIVLAHFLVDIVVIPILCLAIWAGSLTGAALFSPFTVNPGVYEELRLPVPAQLPVLSVNAVALGPGLLNIGALLFAISGYTMWISSRGRSRNRVLGIAIFVTLLQFMVNVIGQLWDGGEFLRPFTVFYYYQPQLISLKGEWTVDPGPLITGRHWVSLNVIAVLVVVGAVGYLMALREFRRRDIPAPL
jgi:ABC-2 type transport system permease protein